MIQICAFWRDVIIRSLVGGYYAFSAVVCLQYGIKHLKGFDPQLPQIYSVSNALSGISMGLFSLTIAGLYVVRLPAVSKFAGTFPAIASILGAYMMWPLIVIGPCKDLPLWASILSCFLLIVSNMLAVWILFWLGRSFSILPEGRKLVTHGPYAFVRHPLYLIEMVGILGTVINFLSWQAVLLFIAQTAMQFTRMHYEEQVLKKSFPEYEAYAAQTRRVIPYLY
ncbi:MAG: isoprenylcysteine carboxylmethyltransferase family protein [Chlorobiaceae bacterium]|nr:isoprenylcysteine carboxylmethyltransferase family protein [Chlorobiaceae bacterium]